MRHVINNASGSLRPLVQKLFSGKMQDFLILIFYPPEVTRRLERENRTEKQMQPYVASTLTNLFSLAHVLATRYSLKRAFTVEYRELLSAILQVPTNGRQNEFLVTIGE